MLRGRGRAEDTLEPVRWGRPRRVVLLRTVVVAALLVTAAMVVWSGAGASEPRTTAGGRGGGDSADGRGRNGGLTAAPGDADGRPGSSDAAGGSSAAGAQTDGSRTTAAASEAGPVPAGGDARMPVPPGMVGVPVRLADPTALTLVRPGDRVDLLRIRDDGGTEPVAQAALALGITGAGDPLTGGLLLALDPKTARRAVASPERGFAVLLRPG